MVSMTDTTATILIVLLVVSIVVNIILSGRLFYMGQKLDKIDRGVDLSKEELIALRNRLESIKNRG